MSWIAETFSRLIGGGQHGAEITSDLRKLRKVADMHFAETCNSNRVFLDNIELQNRSEKTIKDMVDFMSRDRDEAGRS